MFISIQPMVYIPFVVKTEGNFSEVQQKAWAAFKQVAMTETANGSETLSLFRLVPEFSTAPKKETEDSMILMRYWSRKGYGRWLIEEGEELLNWASENGYSAPRRF